MAKYGSDDLKLLIDGYDISGDTFELSMVKDAILEQTHGYGDAWEEHTAVGVFSGGVNHRSFYDDAALATEAALVGNEGVARVLLAMLGGNAQGSPCVAFQGAMTQRVGRFPVRAELHKIDADYLTNGEVDEPTVIQSLAAQTAAGAGGDGSLNNGASSSNGGPAYLEVTALTLGGYTSATIKLQESSDDGGGDAWADVITFAAVTAAQVGERLAIAASTTVEQYLRAELTWNGAGSGQSITYSVAFERD